MTTQIDAHGQVQNGRVNVTLDLGFGSLVLDVEQEGLVDDAKVGLLINTLENAESLITQVLEALAAKAEEADRG